MPKDGFLTAKAVGNRIKAKGLQKLRWYCQMCEKQCRDENGFKCHITSESHQRQMALFAENPNKYLSDYSREFEKDFMDILRRRATKRVKANTIYQEMVGDRNHTHMNSTKWETLSNFVIYLGKSGQATVDETEKGWYLRYIDRDPAAMARQATLKAREGASMDAEERAARTIAKQIALAAAAANETAPVDPNAPTELKRDEAKPLVFSMASSSSSSSSSAGSATATTTPSDISSSDASSTVATSSSSIVPSSISMTIAKPRLASVFGNNNDDNDSSIAAAAASSMSRGAVSSSAGRVGVSMQMKRKKSALDFVMEENERVKEAKTQREIREGKERVDRAREEKAEKARDHHHDDTASETKSVVLDYWLTEGIVVKVMNRSVGDGAYYKGKGVILRVHDRYVAELKMIDTNHILKIDQADLETVIPALDHDVRVVNGVYRGERAILRTLNTAKFSVTVEIASGAKRGKIVDSVPYEHISKIHT